MGPGAHPGVSTVGPFFTLKSIIYRYDGMGLGKCSGSSFVEMFVGVGAKRVREVFE